MSLTPVLVVPGTITATTLRLPDHMAYEDCVSILRNLSNVQKSSYFWIGDALLDIEKWHGEKMPQAAADAGLSTETIRSALWVSQKIPPERRVESLTWTHHQMVAALSPEKQEHWLGYAECYELNTTELRKALKEAREAPESHVLPSLQKTPPGHYPKLLRAAKGRSCIRCENDDDTIVAAHYSGLNAHQIGGGMGRKVHDLATAEICGRCHTEMDSYAAGNDEARSAEFLLLVVKTNMRRLDSGVLELK